MNIEGKPMGQARTRGRVIGVQIDAISWADARSLLMKWGAARESRYICICNVHSVVTATQDPEFKQVLERADLATPDGAPVAWTLRRKGFAGQPRINGPDLMWKLCADAQAQGVGIGLYGSSPENLELLTKVLTRTFPGLAIAYSFSPPFRSLDVAEDETICADINASRAGLLFVGLGCPKQEAWIAAHKGRINAVMLGVGAAFDYHAGTISRAPDWMCSMGLEWFYRLLSEPRRLWKRYFLTNSLFVLETMRDFFRGAFHAQISRPHEENPNDPAQG